MAQPSHLEQRLVALLNPSLNRLAATPWAVIVVAGVAIALTLPLAAVRPEAETRKAEEQPAVVPVAATQPTSSTSPAPQPKPPSLKTPPPGNNIPAIKSMHLEAEAAAPVTAEPAAQTANATAPVVNATVDSTPAPPFDCRVTSSRVQMKTSTIEKSALGSGPWLINDDRTIWAADQPYVANRSVNTVWMRPANTELTITARRLDGEAPQFNVGPAEPYSTGYVAIGVVFPAAGCWEVTGTAGTSKLTFITRVRE